MFSLTPTLGPIRSAVFSSQEAKEQQQRQEQQRRAEVERQRLEAEAEQRPESVAQDDLLGDPKQKWKVI